MVDRPIPERAALVNRVAEYLRSGYDVSVVSPPGNGGSWFLQSLRLSLQESGSEVVFLPRTAEQTPIPSAFSQFLRGERAGEDPFAPLPPAQPRTAQSGHPDARARGLAHGLPVAQLARTVGDKPLVLIAESPQTLTPALRSLLTLYRQQARVNVIALSPQAQPRLLEDSSVILVTLPTLSLDTLRTTLHAKLGAPLETATLGRVYAKSGGLVALAVAICETARIEGRLQLSEGVWSAKDALWSDALIPLMMRYTEDLEIDESRGLEALAETGVIDTREAETLIGSATLGRLEQRGIVVIHHSQDRRWISINPPLVQEMFTHTTAQTRRGLPANAETPSPVLKPPTIQPARYRTHIDSIAPSFLSLLARNRSVELQDATAAFRSCGGRRNALRYAAAMIDERVDPREILRVITAGEAAEGSDCDLAELLRRRAWLYAYCLDDLEGAQRVLTNPDVPAAFRQMLWATWVEIMIDLDHLPETAAASLQLDEQAASEAVPIICHALAVVHLVQARPQLAAAALERIVTPEGSVDHIREVLSGFVALQLGEFDLAFEIACRGFEGAKSELNEGALREYTHLLTLLLLVRGRQEEIEHLRELFDALGGPPLIPRTEYLGALIFSIISARTAEQAQRLIAELDRLRLPGGVSGQIYRDWAAARSAAIDKDFATAARACWRSALTLHEHGSTTLAILSGTRAVDLSFDEGQLQTLQGWSEGVSSVYLNAYLDFVVAREREDVDGLIAVLPGLSRSGRVAQTAQAYREVVRLLRLAGDVDRAQQFEHEGAAFLASLESGVHEEGQSDSGFTRLTDREQEVARLLVQGLTSQEIHRYLSISVRTVENHVHRIKTKIGVSKRSEAIERLRISMAPGPAAN